MVKFIASDSLIASFFFFPYRSPKNVTRTLIQSRYAVIYHPVIYKNVINQYIICLSVGFVSVHHLIVHKRVNKMFVRHLMLFLSQAVSVSVQVIPKHSFC